MLGYLLQVSHHLHKHEWSAAPLDRWIAVMLVILAGLMATRWLPGGVTGVATCGVLLLALWLFQSWAGRRYYILFRQEPPPARHTPGSPILDPMDKLLIRATGLFEVEGKEQTFSELQAYFRSFETREHAVMALAPPSSFLLLGGWPDHEIGMWYMFFKNQDLRRIDPGTLRFGARERPALRLQIEQEIPQETSPLDVWGGYRSGKPRRKLRRSTIYLSFDTPEDRQRVLANLTADAKSLG